MGELPLSSRETVTGETMAFRRDSSSDLACFGLNGRASTREFWNAMSCLAHLGGGRDPVDLARRPWGTRPEAH